MYSDSEVYAAKDEFKILKKRMRFMTWPFNVFIGGFVVIRMFFKKEFTIYIENHSIHGVGLDFIFFLTALSLFFLALYATLKWKCPNCGKRFGRAKNFKHCLHCGIELED